MTAMIDKLDRATHQRRWTAELMAWRDEAAERWTAAWTEWREATEQLDDAASVTVLTEEWPSVEDLGRWQFAVYFQSLKWLWPSVEVLFDKDNPHDRIGRGMGPALRARYGTLGGQSPFVARRPDVVLREAYERTAPVAAEFPGTLPVLAGPAPDETMPGRYRLTPRSVVQAGPRWRPLRWVDQQLQRVDAWWWHKRAERDERMGVGDE